MKRPALHVGDRKYLLLDDALAEEKTGFTLTMNPASRADEPVLSPERPWEVGGILGDSNVSVMDDDGEYKLWYAVMYPQTETSEADVTLADLKPFDAKTSADILASERRAVLCYATSKDGIHWTKPDVGIFEYRGSRKNNMLMIDRLGSTVFRDPTARRDKRYKMIYGGGPRLPHVHIHDDVPTKDIYHAIYGAHSPDGMHWKPYRGPIIPWYTDTTNVAYWDDRIEKYVAFVRWNEGMVFRDGKTVTDKGHRLRYRAIGRTESDDFRSFPSPTKIMEPTPEEREPYATAVDFYNASAAKYPFAADSYFLFSSNFYHEPDTLDVHLCTSRDGVDYTRWREPFVSPGLGNAFDCKCVYMAAGMIRRGDHLYMYYAGYDYPHGVKRAPYSGGIGMVRVRLDGFVSQDARRSGGRLLTVPVRFDGSRLQVNMDAGAGGRLKVELRDRANRPIPGFTVRDADWLWGNDVGKTVTWNGQSDVSRLKGKPVRLSFVGRGVKVYAFQFVD